MNIYILVGCGTSESERSLVRLDVEVEFGVILPNGGQVGAMDPAQAELVQLSTE